MRQYLLKHFPGIYDLLRATFLLLKFGRAGRALSIARSINGFLTDREAVTLYNLTRSCTPFESPIIVEIGSWQGKSTVMLGLGLLGKHRPHLFCIDPFNGDGDAYSKDIYRDDLMGLNNSLKEIFLENIRKAGLIAFTTPCQGYSDEWVERLSIRIDLLFIDGNHEYQVVLSDYELWAPKLNHGGLIVFHDAHHGHPGPQRVFEEKIIPPLWDDVRCIDSLGIARKS